MASYLTLADFRAISLMPSTDVDELEARAPGFLEAQIELASADIDARLRKRYAAPFASPYPVKVRAWCARLVTRVAFLKRGIDPTDPQWAAYDADATKAEAELLEAANAETGLFDLPLRADTTASGLTAPRPLGYSEASPYVWTDVQAAVAHDEDVAGEGSYG
jgi:phage gp36-like protein